MRVIDTKISPEDNRSRNLRGDLQGQNGAQPESGPRPITTAPVQTPFCFTTLRNWLSGAPGPGVPRPALRRRSK